MSTRYITRTPPTTRNHSTPIFSIFKHKYLKGFVFFMFACSVVVISDVLTDKVYAAATPTSQKVISNGLVGWWTFDGKDTTNSTTTDMSGNGNNGTLTNGPTKTIGKIGQGLKFDGVNGYVSLGEVYNTPIKMTVSAWVKVNTNSATTNVFLGNRTSGNQGWSVAFGKVAGTANRMSFTFQGIAEYISPATTISTNTWYFATYVYDSTTATITFYKNGSLVGVSSSVGTPVAGSNLVLGLMGPTGVSGYNFNGSIDDVRIYNRALSQAEVQKLYAAGGEKIAVSPKVATTSPSGLSSGLLGYWTLDGKDTPWSSGVAGTATDLSGNGNNGILTNMSRSTAPTIGKIGQGLKFDGVNDYVNMGNILNIGAADITMSAWIKPPNVNQASGLIMGKRQSTSPYPQYTLFVGSIGSTGNDTASKKISILFYNGGGSFVTTAQAYRTVDDVADGNWHHVVGTRSGSTVKIFVDGVEKSLVTVVGGTITTVSSSANFYVGYNSGAGYYSGLIDDARVYNRALSASEVRQLYSTGSEKLAVSPKVTTSSPSGLSNGLVGYWTFDGKDTTNSTTTDMSGNGNNGTLTNGPTKTIGKTGQGLSFDGVNDYINIPTFNQTLTSATFVTWIKRTGAVNDYNGILFSRGTNVSGMNFRAGTGYVGYHWNNVYSDWDSGLSTPLNKWVLVAITVAPTQAKAYVVSDGNISSATNNASHGSSILNGLRVGYDGFSSRYFPGLIDDTRIYNRALSAAEIMQLYKQGGR